MCVYKCIPTYIRTLIYTPIRGHIGFRGIIVLSRFGFGLIEFRISRQNRFNSFSCHFRFGFGLFGSSQLDRVTLAGLLTMLDGMVLGSSMESSSMGSCRDCAPCFPLRFTFFFAFGFLHFFGVFGNSP